MSTQPDLAEVANLIGDNSRATMLLQLLDGRILPASELARRARITAQTASSHLAKLVQGELIVMEPHGRHRYYRLAGPHVAEVLENLIAIAPMIKTRSLRESDQAKAIRYARTCYDHLAGLLGVKLTQGMLDKGILEAQDQSFILTSSGHDFFERLGLDMTMVEQSKRPLVRPCLDWSERRYHVAGALGAAIAEHALTKGWVKRVPSTRALSITPEGHAAFYELFSIRMEDVESIEA